MEAICAGYASAGLNESGQGMDKETGGSGLDVTVILGGETRVIDVESEESIFAAARRQGLELPFSCVAGVCGACVATLEAGHVEMKANLVLSQKQLDRGLVLVCQARPLGLGCRIRFEGRP